MQIFNVTHFLNAKFGGNYICIINILYLFIHNLEIVNIIFSLITRLLEA
jgi:hypothetical protein